LERWNDIGIVSVYFFWWNKICFEFSLIYSCWSKEKVYTTGWLHDFSNSKGCHGI